MKLNSLTLSWSVSRGRDTYGYNICRLDDGNSGKRYKCNGGGYDMTGTVFGEWLAATYPTELLKLTKEFYGLSFHDPDFRPGQVKIDGQTIDEREAAGKSVGLERYQAFHTASSKLPTAHHTVPRLDGACGIDCMIRVAQAIGLETQRTYNKKGSTTGWLIVEPDGEPA